MTDSPMFSRHAHHTLHAIALQTYKFMLVCLKTLLRFLFMEADVHFVLRFAVLCCACHTGAQTDTSELLMTGQLT